MPRGARFAAAALILAPLALAGLYALLYDAFRSTPTVANVVPGNAILTQRFRDLAALDRGWYRPADDPTAPSERIGPDANLAGLPGVDPHGPIHFVIVPAAPPADPTMMIFPVGSAAAIRARFDDPEFFLRKGWVRHAEYLGIDGDFAAVGGDREAVRHLGEGGLTAKDLGEDDVLAVDVPAFLEFALRRPGQPLWRGVLRGLGFEAEKASPPEGAPSGGPPTLAVPAGRVLRVAGAWQTARLWSWFGEHRIRLDLEPGPGPLRDRMAALREADAGGGTGAKSTGDGVPTAPKDAQAWLRAPSGKARATLAWALFDGGVDVPSPDGATPENPLGALGVGEEGGGLLLYAAADPGVPRAWTLVLATGKGLLPRLDAFFPGVPAPGEQERVPAGLLPLTLADTGTDRPAPAADILHRVHGGVEALVVGAAARLAWDRFLAHLEMEGTPVRVTPPEPGFSLVATFGLSELRVRTILGAQAERGGALAALGGGDVEGALWTDGRILRLEARRSPRP